MNTTEVSAALADVFTELIAGTKESAGPFVLNTGDAGLLRSLEAVTAGEASRSVNDGATTAAHAQHLKDCELNGMIGSIAHVAYHLGAIRQINKAGRGPRGGTFRSVSD